MAEDNTFGVFLGQLKNGSTMNEASEKLRALCESLQDEAVMRSNGVKGKFSITLDIAIEPNGVVEIVPTIVTKAPAPKKEKHVAWVEPKGGRLVFAPPRQINLPLHEVPAPPAPREIATPSQSKEA